MLDTPEASWDKIFEINVKNAFQLIRESVPHLEKQVSLDFIQALA